MCKMDSRVLNSILEQKLVAVVRCDTQEQLFPIAYALLEGGISTIEVTMTVPGAIEGLGKLVREIGGEALVGAGTVLDRLSAVRAIEAGASFIVSPSCIEEVIKAAAERDILPVPGCFTPTEVFVALRLGCPVVKLFPASVLGPKFVREMAGPFPGLRTVVAGGITRDNIGQFLAAGATAFALGGGLVDKKAVNAGSYKVITENAIMFREALG